MAITVHDILMNADAFRRSYPNWPHAEPPANLPARLAAWLVSEGISSAEASPDIAERIISAAGEDTVSAWLGDGTGCQVLRDAAVSIASVADLEPGELAADNYWHGHGQRGCRIGEVVND